MKDNRNVIPFEEKGIIIHPKDMKYDKYYEGKIDGTNLRISNVSKLTQNPIIRVEIVS